MRRPSACHVILFLSTWTKRKKRLLLQRNRLRI
jgi:hypothetical protein